MGIKTFLVRWCVTSISIMVVAHIFSGISADSWRSILVAALLLGVINAFIKPIILFITLPLNILSLGLLTFVINGFLLWMVSGLVKGFEVRGFWTAVLGSMFISVVSFVLNVMIGDGRRVKILL